MTIENLHIYNYSYIFKEYVFTQNRLLSGTETERKEYPKGD